MLLALLAAVRILGFSPDDKQVAWIETGENEGSGEVFARLHVVDVATNAEKVASFDGETAQDKAVKAAKGVWLEPRVIEHDERGELSDRAGAPIGTLELTKKRGKGSCDDPFKPLVLRLLMHFMDDDKPAPVGGEKSPPQFRPCASSCAIDKVYAHGKAALVLIKCTTPGFEGKAESITAFANRLPYGLDEDLPPR